MKPSCKKSLTILIVAILPISVFAQSSFLKSFEQVGGKAFSITTDPIHPRILKTSSSLSTIVYFDNYLNPLFGLDLKIGVDNPGDVFRKSRAITSDKLGNVYYLLNWENLGNDAAIIKIDPNGRVIWQRTISGISFGILLKLQLIANETKLRASGVGIASEKLSYLVTVELDSAGNLIQSSSFRGGGENDAYYWYGSSLSYDMGAIHTGYSANSNDYEHGILCVAKMDSNLNLVWNKSYTVTKTNHPGGNLTEKATVAPCEDGFLIATRCYGILEDDSLKDHYVAILKISESGELLKSSIIRSANPNNDLFINSTALITHNNKYFLQVRSREQSDFIIEINADGSVSDNLSFINIDIFDYDQKGDVLIYDSFNAGDEDIFWRGDTTFEFCENNNATRNFEVIVVDSLITAFTPTLIESNINVQVTPLLDTVPFERKHLNLINSSCGQYGSIPITSEDSVELCIYDSTLLVANTNKIVSWYDLSEPGTAISNQNEVWVRPLASTTFRILSSDGYSSTVYVSVRTDEACYPDISVNYPDTTCLNEITISVSGDTTYSWHMDSLHTEPLGHDSIQRIVLSDGINLILTKGSGDVDTSIIVKFPANSCQASISGDSILCSPQEVTITATPLGNYTWININSPEDTLHFGPTFNTYVDGFTVFKALGNFGIESNEFAITLLTPEACNKAARVYDFVSPNGDHMNEVFFIPNLLDYETRRVKIYNHLNQLVYESEDYQNDFTGSNLPPGIYFYEVMLDDNELVGPVAISE